MRNHVFRQAVVVIALLLPAGSPAFATCGAASGEWQVAREDRCSSRHSPLATRYLSAVVLADGWGIGHFFSGGGRTRVVQVSVVAMCIALFIMMRKFNR